MPADVTKDPIAELRSELRELKESMKERQPSLLGALKTLAIDYRDFYEGNRDFPQAALLGAVFAYLRPRLVLIVGSMGAFVFAGAQIWMLYRQNDLIERQNVLIREQGYALRAQTTATLIGDLKESEEISRTKLSLLAVFGDIGFESLMLLASAPDGNGPRAALVGMAAKLDADQSIRALTLLIETKLNRMNSYVRMQSVRQLLADGRGVQEGPQSAVDWNPDYARFATSRPWNTTVLRATSTATKARLVTTLGYAYGLLFSAVGIHNTSPLPADKELGQLCNALAGTESDLSPAEEILRLARTVPPDSNDVEISTVALFWFHQRCLNSDVSGNALDVTLAQLRYVDAPDGPTLDRQLETIRTAFSGMN